MRKRASLLAVISVCAPAWSADTLSLDPSHTAVVFSWNHLGLSHPWARLEKVTGTVALDPTDLTKSVITVTMPMDGLRTGSPELDHRLAGKDFFDIQRYPSITFRSTRVEITGESNHLRVLGKLLVHAVERPVVLDAHINKIDRTDGSAGFDADTQLRRSDFGLGRYVPMVSDEIHVHITLEAHAPTGH